MEAEKKILEEYRKVILEEIKMKNRVYSHNFYRKRQDKPPPIKVEFKKIVVNWD